MPTTLALVPDIPGDPAPAVSGSTLDEATVTRIWLEIMGCRPGEQPPPAPRRRLTLVPR